MSKIPKTWKEYEKEVQNLEEEGMTTSDAQGVVDAVLMENGYDPITLKKAKELLPDSNFDPKQLAMGIKVEQEHTQNKALAKEIAKDHLAEIPDYYTKLIEMEKEAATPPEKINLKERWDNKEWNKLDGAPDEDVLTQPLRFRKDYMEKNSYYRRNTFYKNDPFWMTSKYGGNCRKCSEAIKKGDEIWYYPKDKIAYCALCGKDAEKDFMSAVEDEEFYNRQYSHKLRLLATSLKTAAGWGLVMVMAEFGVAVAMKDGKFFTAPLNLDDHSFDFNDFKELKKPKNVFLKAINKAFGIKTSSAVHPLDPEEDHWNLHDDVEDDFLVSAYKFFRQDWERLDHYSGRGMFGKSSRCALRSEVSPNSPNGKKFLKETGASVDSLGLGFVYYLR